MNQLAVLGEETLRRYWTTVTVTDARRGLILEEVVKGFFP